MISARSSFASALWVIAGLFAGVILGILASISGAPWLLAAVGFLEPVGAVFVNAIRMAVVPLVVASLIVGIVSITDERSLTRLGVRSLILFVVLAISTAVLAALIAVPIRRWQKAFVHRRRPETQCKPLHHRSRNGSRTSYRRTR
jgi:Na+/H+-dicarboxylate symporter